MAKKRMSKQRNAAARDVQRRLTAYSKAATAVLALGGGAALSLPEESAAAVQYHPNFNKTVEIPAKTWTPAGMKSTIAALDFNDDGSTDIGVNLIRMYSKETIRYRTGDGIYWTIIERQYQNAAYIVASGMIQEFAGSAMVSGGALSHNNWQAAAKYSNGTYHVGSNMTPPPSSSDSSTWSNAPSGDRNVTLGFGFKAADGIHYGWMRVQIPAKIDSITILEYAYEDQANTPIHVKAAVGGVVHDVSDAPIAETQQ